MKRFIFAFALLLTGILSQALTVNDLIKKYKDQPGVTYREVSGKELKNQIDSVSSESEKEVLRTAKKMEVLIVLNDELLDSLSSDVNALSDYSLALSYSGDEGGMAVDVYGKDSNSKEYIQKPVFMIKISAWSVLIYLDGRIRPDNTKDIIKIS